MLFIVSVFYSNLLYYNDFIVIDSFYTVEVHNPNEFLITKSLYYDAIYSEFACVMRFVPGEQVLWANIKSLFDAVSVLTRSLRYVAYL